MSDDNMHVDRDRPNVFSNGNNEYESTINPGDNVQVGETGPIGRCCGFKSTNENVLFRVRFDDGTSKLFERSQLKKLLPSEIQNSMCPENDHDNEYHGNNPHTLDIMARSQSILSKCKNMQFGSTKNPYFVHI